MNESLHWNSMVCDEAHEVMHATGHPSRLHRFEAEAGVTAARHTNFNREELIAEMAASMLLARFNVPLLLSMDRAEYIQRWIEFLTANPYAYSSAATAAERAVTLVAPDLFPSLIPLLPDATTEPEPAPVFTCNECGSVVPEDAAQHFGNRFCTDCAVRLFPRFVRNVNHIHNPRHHGGIATMGFEDEFAVDIDRPDAINQDCAAGELAYLSSRYDGDPLFVTSYDGSINRYGTSVRDSTGIEVVTHPCTAEWWTEHTAIEDMCEIMRRNGFVSHDWVRDGQPGCGLHVHINREWLTDGLSGTASDEFEKRYMSAKLVALFDSLMSERSHKAGYSTLEWFARRKANNYCRMNRAGIGMLTDRREAVALANRTSRFCIRDCHGYPDDRYHVVNLTNVHTVEIRIFRGTANPATVKATLQLVNNAVEYVRTHTQAECCVASLKDVINQHSWDELNTYATKRGLL